MRERLPNRRPNLTKDVVFRNPGTQTDSVFTLTIGVEPVEYLPREIFCTGAKSGAAVQNLANDAAVLASIALQYGATVDELRHSVTREPDGTPSSLVGAMLDGVAEELKVTIEEE